MLNGINTITHAKYHLMHPDFFFLLQETPCELGSNMKVPKGISKLRVRCRDSLLLSQWSDWTPWQNVSH